MSALDAVANERARQHEQWGEQSHPDGTAIGAEKMRVSYLKRRAERARRLCQYFFEADTGAWSVILDEEVAEAYAATTVVELREELVQVAAVAVAWVEAIDRRSV